MFFVGIDEYSLSSVLMSKSKFGVFVSFLVVELLVKISVVLLSVCMCLLEELGADENWFFSINI
ncbi:9492_t:CDS:2 [Acaulospora colombiana]|uniref:9492_t:CDS:1 n=1 Tax=Acaulospora colombiana TaxID=27376 RepID=A0ACA9JV55_9GLOM|nr:9492_t:CDS:2 [Acaulospora colombiana]